MNILSSSSTNSSQKVEDSISMESSGSTRMHMQLANPHITVFCPNDFSAVELSLFKCQLQPEMCSRFDIHGH